MHKGQLEDQPLSTDEPWSVRIADSLLRRYSPASARWHYEHGLILTGVEQLWLHTGEDKYWRFIKDTLDLLVEPDGTIKTYEVEEYNLDQISPGNLLFSLQRDTADARYAKAIKHLRRQLAEQPRTRAGGFWHKQIYPYQMWLDGIYMAGPFYARFASSFDEPAAFDDLAHQIILIEERTRDPRTGLLYHAWDESKQQRWANPQTGCSPHFWGRAMGWFAMAIVDVLDYLPAEHPQRATIIARFRRMVDVLRQIQEPTTGLWYQVLDQGQRAGNYLEASASCMFVYALAKGLRKGYLPHSALAVATRAYHGIVECLVGVDEQGLVNLHGTCSVAGLGGDPYRDGSYEYYISEPIVTNDYKGVGAWLLAAVELERSQEATVKRG